MYRIGICSADKMILKAVEGLVLEKYQLKVSKYMVEKDFLKEFTNKKNVEDILILDIQWSSRCILLAKMIQEKNIHTKLIFIAANVDEVVNIFEVEPTYLLLKPLDKQKLYYAIDKAIQRLSNNNKQQVLKVRFKDKFICIPLQEIFFIESDLRYLVIHQKNKTDRILMKMSEIREMLPDYFIRCHQSYMFNVNYMVQFERYKIVMQDGSCIAVSRNRFEETKRAIEKYYGMQI